MEMIHIRATNNKSREMTKWQIDGTQKALLNRKLTVRIGVSLKQKKNTNISKFALKLIKVVNVVATQWAVNKENKVRIWGNWQGDRLKTDFYGCEIKWLFLKWHTLTHFYLFTNTNRKLKVVWTNLGVSAGARTRPTSCPSAVPAPPEWSPSPTSSASPFSSFSSRGRSPNGTTLLSKPQPKSITDHKCVAENERNGRRRIFSANSTGCFRIGGRATSERLNAASVRERESLRRTPKPIHPPVPRTLIFSFPTFCLPNSNHPFWTDHRSYYERIHTRLTEKGTNKLHNYLKQEHNN